MQISDIIQCLSDFIHISTPLEDKVHSLLSMSGKVHKVTSLSEKADKIILLADIVDMTNFGKSALTKKTPKMVRFLNFGKSKLH